MFGKQTLMLANPNAPGIIIRAGIHYAKLGRERFALGRKNIPWSQGRVETKVTYVKKHRKLYANNGGILRGGEG